MPSIAGSLEDSVLYIDLHQFYLVSAPAVLIFKYFEDYLCVHCSFHPSSFFFWPHLSQVLPTDGNNTEILIFYIWIDTPVSLKYTRNFLRVETVIPSYNFKAQFRIQHIVDTQYMLVS